MRIYCLLRQILRPWLLPVRSRTIIYASRVVHYGSKSARRWVE